MYREKISFLVTSTNKEPENQEEHLPFQKDKLLQILEVRLELCIQKMEFLKQALKKLKKEFADLEMDWEKRLPGLREEILQLYETMERNK